MRRFRAPIACWSVLPSPSPAPRLAWLAGCLFTACFLALETLPLAYGDTATSTFVYPTNGAQNVATPIPFQWTAVSGALAYYLYVGTAPALKDLVNTGEMQQTSYQVASLPSGQTLYGRIWTKTSTAWFYSDISFTAAWSPARFLYPTDNAQNVTTSTPFSWTAVPGALAYYLYVGTTVGTKDLVDTGEMAQTSYTVNAPLPYGQTLYARIYTKMSTGWFHSDISFTAAITPARFIYPTTGAQNVDTPIPFQWTVVSGALAYYLYVGTAPGLKDLVNTGEMQTTSYQVASLPSGQMLYGRIWTKTSTGWSYSDISFTAAVTPARFLYPANNAQNVTTSTPFSWTAVPGALAYYLYVGTAVGTKDLVDTGEIPQTSYTVNAQLPYGQTLYARIYTKMSTGWFHSDISFTAAWSPAKFVAPFNNPLFFDTSNPFTWSTVPGELAYYLYVGASLGAKDIIDTGEIQQTSYLARNLLPAGQISYARIWTKSPVGTWSFSDCQFEASMAFGYPVNGSVSVSSTSPFFWSQVTSPAGGTTSYRLTIGTTPAGKDLLDSGTLTQTSYTVPTSALPINQTLYARVMVTRSDGSSRVAASIFTAAGSLISPAQMIYPTLNANNVNVSNPFQWTQGGPAQAYQLQILSNATSAIVRDSQAIHIPRYFAEDLPLGSYTAHLGTKIAGQWYYSDPSFTVVANGGQMVIEVQHAQWAASFVRAMADAGHHPFPGTPLWTQVVSIRGHSVAVCSDYAYVLADVLQEMNIAGRLDAQHQPRVINISFITNHYDTHTLVEMFHSDDNTWIIIDPTFELMAQRTSDGHWATKDDIHNATVASNWLAISYVCFGPNGTQPGIGYYLDYPLLFLNILPLALDASEADPRPYMQSFAQLPSGITNGLYILTSNQTPLSVIINGQQQTLDCSAIYGFCHMFFASSIRLPDGSIAQVQAWQPLLYVFH